MDAPGLPSELAALEQPLLELATRQPAADFRARLLRSVEGELRRQRLIASFRRVTAAAAIVLLWANLSWLTCRVNFNPSPPSDSEQFSAEEIEGLVPGISPREARRQAFVLNHGVRLSVLSNPPAAILRPFGVPTFD